MNSQTRFYYRGQRRGQKVVECHHLVFCQRTNTFLSLGAFPTTTEAGLRPLFVGCCFGNAGTAIKGGKHPLSFWNFKGINHALDNTRQRAQQM